MENTGESNDRTHERGKMASFNDGQSREMSRGHPADSTKDISEKNKESQRSPLVPSSQHLSALSSATGALDFQAMLGRPGSSISGITVPIRLDALSYLLNSAVMASSRWSSQMPSFPPMYTSCSYPQTPCCPHSICLGPQVCPTQLPNQQPYCQPVLMNAPAGQQHPTSLNQSISFNPQMAIEYNPTGTAFNEAGSSPNAAAQPESSSWARKASDRFGSNDRFSNERGDQKSFTQSRFGDQNNEDSWSSRNQNRFGRGFGNDRGAFRGSSWRGNSRGRDNEWRYNDRSRNTEFGEQKRMYNSPERSQDGNSNFKRGRWPGNRGEPNRDSWQQRNRQQESGSMSWSNRASTSHESDLDQETKMDIETSTTGDGNEDWETDYPGDKPTTENPKSQSPKPSSPKSNDKLVDEEFAENVQSPKPSPTKGNDTTFKSPDTLKPDDNDDVSGNSPKPSSPKTNKDSACKSPNTHKPNDNADEEFAKNFSGHSPMTSTPKRKDKSPCKSPDTLTPDNKGDEKFAKDSSGESSEPSSPKRSNESSCKPLKPNDNVDKEFAENFSGPSPKSNKKSTCTSSPLKPEVKDDEEFVVNPRKELHKIVPNSKKANVTTRKVKTTDEGGTGTEEQIQENDERNQEINVDDTHPSVDLEGEDEGIWEEVEEGEI